MEEGITHLKKGGEREENCCQLISFADSIFHFYEKVIIGSQCLSLSQTMKLSRFRDMCDTFQHPWLPWDPVELGKLWDLWACDVSVGHE